MSSSHSLYISSIVHLDKAMRIEYIIQKLSLTFSLCFSHFLSPHFLIWYLELHSIFELWLRLAILSALMEINPHLLPQSPFSTLLSIKLDETYFLCGDSIGLINFTKVSVRFT